MTISRNLLRLWLCIGAIITFALLISTGETITMSDSWMAAPLAMLGTLLYGHFYRPGEDRTKDRIVVALECFGLFTLAVVTGAIATYPLASLSAGWADKSLLAADAALGLDWLEYWRFVEQYRWLKIILAIAYSSIGVTPLIIICAQAYEDKQRHTYHFIAAFLLALMLTAAVFPLFPGKSPAVYFLPGALAEMPCAGIDAISIIENLRSGTLTTVDMEHLAGLIAFPSFHAAACILFVWGAWSVAWLRGPMLILNGLMFCSAPIQGGHYFVDALAGAAVGGAAITIVTMIARSSELSRIAAGQMRGISRALIPAPLAPR